MLTQIFHLHALSALHVGSGQALGAVDLPVARARATHLPIVPGSALKGVLRDEFAADERQQKTLLTLFGPPSIDSGDAAYAGALAFGDAQLLLLPVRSLAGIVAFVTCPFVLARYAEDLRRETLAAPTAAAAGGAVGVVRAAPTVREPPDVPPVDEQQALVCQSTKIIAQHKPDALVVLEDLDLRASGQNAGPHGAAPGADAWAERIAARVHPGDKKWQALLGERFAIISDADFSFLADTATEVRARIRIDDSRGVVDNGALWYEENLPAETVLWGQIAAGPARDGQPLAAAQTLAAFRAGLAGNGHGALTLQIGGKATIGRGLVRFVLPPAADKAAGGDKR